jgi:hypothetical protein
VAGAKRLEDRWKQASFTLFKTMSTRVLYTSNKKYKLKSIQL